MQFHLNGFETGDPRISPEARRSRRSDEAGFPAEVDVLIVGCGPAGLTLAAQLAAFPDISTCIVEQKPGPLELGQADGVACRTVEMFNAFGFAEQVLQEAYWVNETSFWRPDPEKQGITRGGWVQDTEPGLSEFPHVILNQARVHDLFLQTMRNAPAVLEPLYRRRLIDLEIDSAASAESAAPHPVTARFEVSTSEGETRVEMVKARYVVGCDGARSTVRKSLGLMLEGDSANQAWGVMDVLAVTDFPDIRFKSVINSKRDGSVVLIPREGGYLVRIYVEIDKLREDERVTNRNMTVDDVIAAARRVLHPYSLDVREVAWWSVYEIGQRLCDRFDDVPAAEVERRTPRAFIAGDACHTHSPKAGQGMNVSMQDAFNLGWKLASVLLGRSPPELLRTYSAERQSVAKELIDFDREWAAMLSAASKPATDGESGDVGPEEVQEYFVRHGRYTAGTATHYAPSVLTGSSVHQDLAGGFVIGTRFHSAPVIRWADARPMHLGHVLKADGRWRLFAFAGAGDDAMAEMVRLCDFLSQDAASPIVRYTPAGTDVDAVIDLRGIFQQQHRTIVQDRLPGLLFPQKGRLGLRDYEKVFCADFAADIFDLREIDRGNGCLVVVRPDQYVAHVLPLNARKELADFFGGFMIEAHRANKPAPANL